MGSLILVSVVVPIAVAVLVLVMVFKRLGGMSRTSKIRDKGGLPGQATILSIAETGMTINETNAVLRFGLAVQVQGRPQYQVEITQSVPRIAMGMVAPGRVVAVWVDPADQSKVAIDFSMVPPAAAGPPTVIGLPGQPAGAAAPAAPGTTFHGDNPAETAAFAATLAANPGAHVDVTDPHVGSAQEILDTGKPARATIVNTFDVNMVTPDGDPVVGYILNVQPDDGTPAYQATLGHRTPKALGRTPGPGTQLAVKYVATNPTEVAIDWHASGLA
jgi:hypothetical protein